MVTHATGFKEPDVQELFSGNRILIERNGAKILSATHVFRILGRAIFKKFGTIQIEGIEANVLHIFGHGMKVVCEITCMAADRGLIRTDEEVIDVGGSGGGGDTAVVIKPVTLTHFLI